MRHRSALGALIGAWAAIAFGAPSHAQQAVPRESGVINVRGEAHTYLAEGRGEPCIVVGLAPQYPPLFSARLKQHVRLIFVDFRKTWDAPEGQSVGEVTMDTLVEEVDDVRKAFGMERACLVGHSTPGLVALEYAARHPDRTSRLILVGVTPFYNKVLIDTWSTFWDSDASPERKAALAQNMRRLPDGALARLSRRDAFGLRYARTGPRLFYDPSYDFYWAWIGRQFSEAMLTHFWTAIVADYDPWPRFAANRVPMFVALGRYDYAVPYHLWDRMRGVPGLTFEMFDRSAHFPMFEQADAFDRALIAWQDRTAKAAR